MSSSSSHKSLLVLAAVGFVLMALAVPTTALMWQPDPMNTRRVMEEVCGRDFYVEAIDLRRALKTSRLLDQDLVALYVKWTFAKMEADVKPVSLSCRSMLLDELLAKGGKSVSSRV